MMGTPPLPLQGRERNLSRCFSPGQEFDPATIPDPLYLDGLEAGHGRGICLMKSAMDEISFQWRGAGVHMFKSRCVLHRQQVLRRR